MNMRCLPTSFAAVLLLLVPTLGWSEEDAAGPATLRELIDDAVTQMEVFRAGEDESAKPLVALRWANNQRGSEDGTTLLYIRDGRPLATACLYPWQGRLIHDFEALSRDKVEARRRGSTNIVWRPKESGVAFADIPDAPVPEATPAQRLRQMKSLSEQFQSTMLGWKLDDTDREELRLLPRPLYRYEAAEDSIIDGAVFAFVMGTDPESLLLIEAVRENGKEKWQYGFARRTSGQLEGRHRDKIVWTAVRYPEEHDPAKPHFSVGTRIPPELLPTDN
jgi:hypothetical protein